MKYAVLGSALLLLGSAPYSEVPAFSFRVNGPGSTLFHGFQPYPAPFKTGASKVVGIGKAPPLPYPPEASPDTTHLPPGYGAPGLQHQPMLTPVIHVQSIANVRLSFSLVTLDGAPCVKQSIAPDSAISLPACGVRLHWHDGHRFEDADVSPMRVYRFEWKDSKWTVEDITASLEE